MRDMTWIRVRPNGALGRSREDGRPAKQTGIPFNTSADPDFDLHVFSVNKVKCAVTAVP